VAPPTKTPVFISFDYDHDVALKEFLVGQAKNEDSPFFIQDWSIKIQIAREVGVRYVLLRGYKDGKVERPAGTSWFSDEIYDWTWDNLRKLTDMRPWWQKIW
jgi:hypothetical protein